MSAGDDMPRYNAEVEQCVIGSMLLDNSTIPDVAEWLRPEDFFVQSHQDLYRAILELYERSGAADPILLAEELRRRGCLDKVGGEEAIRDAQEQTPSAVNAEHYADIVRQLAVVRQLEESGHEIIRDVRSKSHDCDQLLELAERRIFAIGQRQSRREPRRMDSLSDEVFGQIEARKDGPGSFGLMSGFADLDHLTLGFRPTQMIVLAARPSMGKTAIAMGIADHAARQGDGVLFVSMEMDQVQLTERFLSMRSGVEIRAIRNPRSATPEELLRIKDARAEDGFPLWVDDFSSATATQIVRTARRFKARHDIGLLVVDYLQLMMPEDGKRPRQEQVAEMSRRLKQLALELKIPVIALSQLNRDLEKREDRRPRLADLRESGAIEQDADIVLLLHRPEYYNPEDTPGKAELIVAKHRNGETDTIRLDFEKRFVRFKDQEEQHYGIDRAF